MGMELPKILQNMEMELPEVLHMGMELSKILHHMEMELPKAFYHMILENLGNRRLPARKQKTLNFANTIQLPTNKTYIHVDQGGKAGHIFKQEWKPGCNADTCSCTTGRSKQYRYIQETHAHSCSDK